MFNAKKKHKNTNNVTSTPESPRLSLSLSHHREMKKDEEATEYEKGRQRRIITMSAARCYLNVFCERNSELWVAHTERRVARKAYIPRIRRRSLARSIQ